MGRPPLIMPGQPAASNMMTRFKEQWKNRQKAVAANNNMLGNQPMPKKGPSSVLDAMPQAFRNGGGLLSKMQREGKFGGGGNSGMGFGRPGGMRGQDGGPEMSGGPGNRRRRFGRDGPGGDSSRSRSRSRSQDRRRDDDRRRARGSRGRVKKGRKERGKERKRKR